MRNKPEWYSYGRPLFHYIGGAVMAVFSVVGVFLTANEILTSGLPWWGWMLTALLGLFLLIYAHMRQWREWNKEIKSLKLRLGGTIRLASQREIDSPYESAPHGRLVVFQTLRPLDRIRFEILCSAPVDGAKIEATYFNMPGAYNLNFRHGLNRSVLLAIQGVQFLPETPLMAKLYGPRPFEVLGVADDL